MPRFFVAPDNIHGGKFILTGSEARHAALVLRKKMGDVLDLFDGKDRSYQGQIESLSPERIEGAILTQRQAIPASKVDLILCQALIKGPKWDWLVEKACEVGVTKLQPLVTARTVIKPSRSEARERWKRIALAASKQCGRPNVMEVDAPQSFSEALNNLPKSGLSLIPWEKENETTIKQACHSLFPSPSPLPKGRGPTAVGLLPMGEGGRRTDEGAMLASVFIGPEGGWETQEVDAAVRHGAIPVRLGPTLLRSETAGLVAATLVLSELGVYS
jgi:16S rRNA (uracil1498-N3)-methyltransferase